MFNCLFILLFMITEYTVNKTDVDIFVLLKGCPKRWPHIHQKVGSVAMAGNQTVNHTLFSLTVTSNNRLSKS